MKFINIATSALIAGSALAAPTRHGNHGGHRNVAHHNTARHAAYSRAEEQKVASKEQEPFFVRPIDLASFIVPKDIYNTIQELAKIPEKDFVSGANELVQKLQTILDISFDFTLRVELLDDKSRAELEKWIDEVAPEYENFTLQELESKKDQVIDDLLELADIVYKDEVPELLEELEKKFPNTI
ncbi:hypothetical protein CONCODRAFT_85806 [Conidiobolus coronatus NRRL 28638]|uniref:Uncharacterized protein n=1 Tax=Conidiobolus coronatus (strain ATCC 28846 / CBS 209.66 / NRRL 28638) TaxID=796925 RepID=A0A137P3K7_CONC2|nr:hypothetical protein CONCODRAFT_85806 [Conidiobolus coronatus NRRL 28638]|eukprot:KXN69605.1 hypothetical protein CONCODRAFT_85806 [Conidiobolus coronatus NRRL 28638]